MAALNQLKMMGKIKSGLLTNEKSDPNLPIGSISQNYRDPSPQRSPRSQSEQTINLSPRVRATPDAITVPPLTNVSSVGKFSHLPPPPEAGQVKTANVSTRSIPLGKAGPPRPIPGDNSPRTVVSPRSDTAPTTSSPRSVNFAPSPAKAANAVVSPRSVNFAPKQSVSPISPRADSNSSLSPRPTPPPRHKTPPIPGANATTPTPTATTTAATTVTTTATTTPTTTNLPPTRPRTRTRPSSLKTIPINPLRENAEQQKAQNTEAQTPTNDIDTNVKHTTSKGRPLSSNSLSAITITHGSRRVETKQDDDVDDDEKWGDPEKEAYRVRQNQRVIEELVSTELEYITDLEMVVDHVLRPMELKKNFLTGENLVTPAQIAAIFSNLHTLPPINREFHKMLVEELNNFNEGKEAMIGKVFMNIADFFRIYSIYFANQPNSNKTILELRSNSQFDAFLDEKRDLIPEFKNLDLQAMLIKPTQRMCKYPLFLRELINFTRKSHPDYPNLKASLEKVDNVVKEINERKREIENQSILMNIRAQMTSKSESLFQIVKPLRSLIRQTQCKKITFKGKSFKGNFYIFSDAVLVTKQKDKKQSYQIFFDLGELTIDDANEKKYPNALALGDGDPKNVVIISFIEDKQQWRTSLVTAMKQASHTKISDAKYLASIGANTIK